ncbi:MAG TPA: 2'-5' RNA ligase family protein [Candidatus Saccharimonadales bacterium]
MPYSQKYCLVSFISPANISTEFDTADWPLHVTLADVFATDRAGTTIEAKLAEMLAAQPPVATVAGKETTLGTTSVVLLDKNKALLELHDHLITLLEANGAVFNAPEFTREGFLPHCTVQRTGRLQNGDRLKIDTIALVDMFPDNNWQRRKVISIFKLWR